MSLSEGRINKAKIMVIEDHTDSREMLSFLLQDYYEVESFGTATDALQVLGAKKPHIVLCDLLLPDLTGWEFVRNLRSNGDGTPVIAVTAHVVAGARDKALAEGFNDFVAKPIMDLEALRLTIEQLLDGQS